jgi:hypothetical protein
MSKKPPRPVRGLLIGVRKERRLPVLIKLFDKAFHVYFGIVDLCVFGGLRKDSTVY